MTFNLLQNVDTLYENAYEKNFLEEKSIINDVWPILSTNFANFMAETHSDLAIPISIEFIKKYCEENINFNIKFEDYRMKKVSNLSTNAFLNKQCPFFMKRNNSLAKHLSSSKTTPAFN
jgi:hypothetical protein